MKPNYFIYTIELLYESQQTTTDYDYPTNKFVQPHLTGLCNKSLFPVRTREKIL